MSVLSIPYVPSRAITAPVSGRTMQKTGSRKSTRVIIDQKQNLTLCGVIETHSLAEYWEQTEAAEFEIDPHAHRRYLVAFDPELLQCVQRLAQTRGLSTECLVNLLLEQRTQQLESQVA